MAQPKASHSLFLLAQYVIFLSTDSAFSGQSVLLQWMLFILRTVLSMLMGHVGASFAIVECLSGYLSASGSVRNTPA
jgi:hypothetical protein